ERYALLHPAGELVDARMGELLELDGRKVALDPFFPVPAGDPCDAQSEFDVPRHVEPREQRGVLEDDDPIRAWAVHAVAIHLDPAGRRVLEARDQAEERGLSAAGGSDDRDELPLSDLEVPIAEGLRLARFAPEAPPPPAEPQSPAFRGP